MKPSFPWSAADRIRSDILTWVNRLAGNGAAVVVATHEIEPFAAKAVRALAASAGTVRLVEPLPQDEPARLALLQTLA